MRPRQAYEGLLTDDDYDDDHDDDDDDNTDITQGKNYESLQCKVSIIPILFIFPKDQLFTLTTFSSL